MAYLAVLPRDMRFALVKSLVAIPQVAMLLVQEKHDAVVMEAVRAIRRDAAA
ncbi:MAG TPA: hypothetical protein VNX25_09940 [Verrucomicrobiae bacterium]|nr:hypothetical protein [Verrucomicrobiae bacterium]